MNSHRKRLISLFVCALYCSSCSSISGNKLNRKRVQSTFVDFGYQEVDYYDLVYKLDDSFFSDTIDEAIAYGVYASTSNSDDIEEAFNDYLGNNRLAYIANFDSNMDSITWFVRTDEVNNSRIVMSAILVEFDSKENAMNYLDEMSDDTSYVSSVVHSTGEFYFSYNSFDKGLEDDIAFYVRHMEHIPELNEDQLDCICFGLYQQEEYVFIVLCSNTDSNASESAMDEICNAMEITSFPE